MPLGAVAKAAKFIIVLFRLHATLVSGWCVPCGSDFCVVWLGVVVTDVGLRIVENRTALGSLGRRRSLGG